MRKSIIVSLRGGDFWDIWYGVGVRPQNGPGGAGLEAEFRRGSF